MLELLFRINDDSWLNRLDYSEVKLEYNEIHLEIERERERERKKKREREREREREGGRE